MKLLLILSFLVLAFKTTGQTEFRFRDPGLPTQERVNDLLNHMTLEEKIGQLLCPLGWEMVEKQGNHATHSAKFGQFVKERHIGMLWATFRADPWTGRTLETGLNPVLAAEAANALQRYVIENTRLGIPVFLAEEAPHGHMAIGTTVFPTAIGLASTWSPALLEEMGSVISREIRLQGGHIGYGPIMDLARDPRWSRVEETFGEDPVLVSRLGSAIVRGMGGGDLGGEFSIISTLKHFLAYGVPEGGRNGSMAQVGPVELHADFLPPFRAAVDAGALSVMTSYNSIDGMPTTASHYLLTEILRDKWGFGGFVISDLGSIEGLRGSHRIARTIEDASVMALAAGVDVDLGGNAYTRLVSAVNNGYLDESSIDIAAGRVLALKFEMGLFENPFVCTKEAGNGVRRTEHIELARQIAEKSIVLLENRNNILPLDRNKIGKIAVIGPNANNVYNMLGDYTAPQDRENIATVLDGISSIMGPSKVDYVRGCAIRDTTWNEIGQAVAAARDANVAVVVVGGSSARDFETTYIDTGAAIVTENSISDMDAGEGYDRATLDLLGLQHELLEAVRSTGTPMIVIYIQGRPMNMNWASEHADALITAWYPGQEGGNAIAGALFGEFNPGGRLPVSVPRHEGQIPIHYNRKNPRGHDYVEMENSPLYSFGYGLSYTDFEYDNLHVEKTGDNRFSVSFTVSNTGAYDGDEVAQLYLRKEYMSTVQPLLQLAGFERVFLKKGETRKFSFLITEDDLAIINSRLERVTEPGTFHLMVGSSSGDIRLRTILSNH